MMKYQHDGQTSVRWIVGMLGVMLYVWGCFIAYIIVMLDMRFSKWLVEWLTYGALACVIVVVLLPRSTYEKSKKGSKSAEVGDG